MPEVGVKLYRISWTDDEGISFVKFINAINAFDAAAQVPKRFKDGGTKDVDIHFVGFAEITL